MGSEVARRGIGLGFASVIAYDPYASDVKAAALGVKLVPWEEALARGDFFSLHMPMTATTKARGPCCCRGCSCCGAPPWEDTAQGLCDCPSHSWERALPNGMVLVFLVAVSQCLWWVM